jgi:hypothetical protein
MKTLAIVAAIIVLASGCGRPQASVSMLSPFNLDETKAIVVGDFQVREIAGANGEYEGEVHRFAEAFRVTNRVEIARLVSTLSPLNADGPGTGAFSGYYPPQLYLDGDGQVLACVLVVIDGTITVDRNVARHGILYLGTNPTSMLAGGRNLSYTRATYDMMKSRDPVHLETMEEQMDGKYGEMMHSYLGGLEDQGEAQQAPVPK